MYRQHIQKAWGHTAYRGWAHLLLDRARDLIIHGPAHPGANGAATRARPPPTPALRWHIQDGHVKDVAQGVAEDVPQDAAQDLAFGARAAHALLATPPPPQPLSLCSSH